MTSRSPRGPWRAFPMREPAHENATLVLNSQVTLLRAVVAAEEEAEAVAG